MKKIKSYKRYRIPLYDAGFEFSPHIADGLAPRHHITKSIFEKISIHREKEIGGRFCEICRSRNKIQLHESFKFDSNKYIFKGFHLVCKSCHDCIHKIKASGSMIGYIHSNDFREYGLRDLFSEITTMDKCCFSDNKQKREAIYKAMTGCIEFILSDTIDADYSSVTKYGLDSDVIYHNFLLKYNHDLAQILFIFLCLGNTQFKEEGVIYNHKLISWDSIHENNDIISQMKKYNGKLLLSTVKHKDFLIEHHKREYSFYDTVYRKPLLDVYLHFDVKPYGGNLLRLFNESKSGKQFYYEIKHSEKIQRIKKQQLELKLYREKHAST